MGGHALTPPTRLSLGKPLPHQLADSPLAPPRAPKLQLTPSNQANIRGLSHRFQWLSPSLGQVTNVLLTRPPLSVTPKGNLPFDLHVLSMPPAFNLSQDQTLQFKIVSFFEPSLGT